MTGCHILHGTSSRRSFKTNRAMPRATGASTPKAGCRERRQCRLAPIVRMRACVWARGAVEHPRRIRIASAQPLRPDPTRSAATPMGVATPCERANSQACTGPPPRKRGVKNCHIGTRCAASLPRWWAVRPGKIAGIRTPNRGRGASRAHT